MRRCPIRIRTALILFLVAIPVSTMAETAPEKENDRNPVVWLLEDLGKVFAGITEISDRNLNTATEATDATLPTAQRSNDEAVTQSTQDTTATTSQPRGFVNPFTAMFNDLAALFGSSGTAKPEKEDTEVAGTPTPASDEVKVDAASTTAQPTNLSGTPRNPVTWLLSDLAALFKGSNTARNDDSMSADATSSDTGLTETSERAPHAQETTDLRAGNDAVPVEAASIVEDATSDKHPIARLFGTILAALQSPDKSTSPPATQERAPETEVVVQSTDEPQMETVDTPVEIAASNVPNDLVVEGPWTQRHASDAFDPTSRVVTSQPSALESDEIAGTDSAPKMPVSRDESELAILDIDPVIRQRAAPIYEARNHRSVGTGVITPEESPREESLLANFMDSMFGEDESVETIGKKISDRIVAEEKLDLGYVRPDPVTATPAPEKTLIGKSVLTEIDLYLGRNTMIGMPYDPARYGAQSCLERPLHASVFCLTNLDWPASIGASFEQDTAFFEAGEAVARYENGTLSRVYTVFNASDFADVVKFMQRRFGAPMEREVIWMHMMEAPELPNTTFRWKAVSEDRRDVIVLEVRNYDDLRRSFANTDHGMIRLYREGSRPVFKHLTTMDLMLMQRRRISRAPVDVNAPPPQ